jgi:hypothetical protein
MEQVLILALMRSRLPVKTSIVVSKPVASDPAVRWGNDLDREDIAGRMLWLQQYRSR